MFVGENIIKEDFRTVLYRNGFPCEDFKITVENGSGYDPHQIVSSQVWIIIERNEVKKKYELYRSNWPYDFEADLKNGYFNYHMRFLPNTD